MKTIDIIIDNKGNTQVQTRGFSGSDCLAASRFIESTLGSQINQRTTSEFFVTKTEQQQRSVTGR